MIKKTPEEQKFDIGYATAECWDEEEEEEEECCPEGYSADECCDCHLRGGIESCEFCQFCHGPLPRACNTKECEERADRYFAWQEAEIEYWRAKEAKMKK